MARGDTLSRDSRESHRSFSRDNHLAEIRPNFSGSHTFYLTATVLPCPPECNFQSETKTEPDLRSQSQQYSVGITSNAFDNFLHVQTEDFIHARKT